MLQLKSGQITAGGKRSLSEKKKETQNQIFTRRDKKDGWRQDGREGREEGRRDGKWGTCLKEGAER